MRPSQAKASSKGEEFRQPTQPQQHWHIDISYLNICGNYFEGIFLKGTQAQPFNQLRKSEPG
jgi:hypothetical protein